MSPFQFLQKDKLSKSELNLEKRKDYRNIVYLQMIIVVSAMLLKEILAISGVNLETSNLIRDVLFLILGFLYVLVLWDLLRNLINNVIVIEIMLIAIICFYIIAIITVNPFYDFFSDAQAKRPYLFTIHITLFIIEALVIYYSVFDIFTGRKLSAEKIWGAACIFLMIGISFGSLYDIINIIHPGSMGIPLELGLESYTVCIYYSMTIIGGHDAFLEAIPVIQNLGIIEAVWSNLFIVLLVGRLLGKPDKEDEE